MLKLLRLDVSGFKSFVDPVTVDFAGGLTAIVGPNGCGKSNLSEAITWALGEQSAKSLRGETMEDVIFNGSENRRPLGMAEVAITLQTDPGTAGAEDGRLVLARRVFRSGESQYRLNGKNVRLKDFKDLLMDTGLGIRAYSVIEQGKIGMILSGKPQERRRLIEEAAGVTRYKARKRIAELKLEEATANLLRLEDIVQEVERNLRSLKRQAGAARRYQEKQQELRTLLRQTLVGRWRELQGRLSELGQELAAATGRDAELAAELHRGEADLAAGRERLDRMSQELAARHQRQAELGAVVEGRQEYLKASRSTLLDIGQRTTTGAAVAERRAAETAEQAAALATLDAARVELAGQRDTAAAEVAEDDRRIAESDQAVRAAELSTEDLRTRLLASLGEATRLRNELHREEIENEKGSLQHRQLGEQLSLFSTQIEESSQALEIARQHAADLDSRLQVHDAAHADVAQRVQALQAREAELDDEQRRLEGEIQSARQRQEVLSALSAATEERRESWRAALTAAGLEQPDFLGDRLTARPGWERSLDLYLGELEDAVVLPADSDALALAGRLAHTGTAGRILRPLAGSFSTVDDPAVVASLGESLGLPADLAAALPPAYLVREASDAERLAHRHPGVAFVAQDRLWAQSGVLHVQGDQAQPGLLAREREAREIAERLPALRLSLSAATAELAERRAERVVLEADLRRLAGEIAALRQELAVARARFDDAGTRHRRLAVEHQTLSTERAEVERELVRVAERAEQLAADLGRAEARHAELERSFDACQAETTAARAEREARRTAGAGRRGRLDLLDERLRSHDVEAGRLRRQLEEWRRQEDAWREESAALEARRHELAQGIERAEVELQEALTQRAEVQDGLLGEQERIDGLRAELAALDEGTQARRQEREAARGGIEELRVRRAGLEHDAEHLAQQHQQEFHEPPPADAPVEVGDLAELEQQLAACRDALEKIGPVNVLAADEYTEQEERHKFLTTQRADVAQSVDSLRKTIKEINQTSSERFRETFAVVNQSFSETFVRLFRGGEAEMRLLDEDDLLESGIEIVARPPGKKLQNIMLLSGGEKALTAIALLFALFRTKPSPFCILDEVDAPLDDVNTLRFVDLLRELAGDTQFMVITHNKLTMEVASTLYGVTMEERGCSKLVAVALEEIQPESRAASA